MEDQHDHGHHHGRPRRKLRHNWRLWLVVGLMLAAMLMYVLSDNEQLGTGTRCTRERSPARPGNAVILVESGGRISDERDSNRKHTLPNTIRTGPKPAILILIGLVVGGVLYFGVMAWYFKGVDPGDGPCGLRRGCREDRLPLPRARGTWPFLRFRQNYFRRFKLCGCSILPLAWGSPWYWLSLYLASCIRILNEYQRGVIFRLGRAMPTPEEPGLIMVFSPDDTMTRRWTYKPSPGSSSPRTSSPGITSPVRVNAVLYFRVVDPMRSVLEVADFFFTASQVALTTLCSTLGQAELDDLLTERDKVNRRLQEIIDGHP